MYRYRTVTELVSHKKRVQFLFSNIRIFGIIVFCTDVRTCTVMCVNKFVKPFKRATWFCDINVMYSLYYIFLFSFMCSHLFFSIFSIFLTSLVLYFYYRNFWNIFKRKFVLYKMICFENVLLSKLFWWFNCIEFFSVHYGETKDYAHLSFYVLQQVTI